MVKRVSMAPLVMLTSVGCSLLVDNSPFLGSDAGGQPDAGGRDAGTDGGSDAGPNAPTTPEIHIEPAEPRTLDDLSVVIDVDSTDPLAAGVTYEYRWMRDEENSGETGTSVAHALTAKIRRGRSRSRPSRPTPAEAPRRGRRRSSSTRRRRSARWA